LLAVVRIAGHSLVSGQASEIIRTLRETVDSG
jgi:hypothetical protein